MPLITTTITPFTKTPSRQNPSTFSADMDDRLSEENSRITQMNSQSSEMNDVADLINTQSTSINTVSTNIAAVNTVATDISKVNTVSTNIAKVSNLDTNMTKIQNLDTNMTKIANVDNNMTKVQNLDTNMTAITTVNTNIASVNTVSTNIANVIICATNIGTIASKVSMTGDETIAGVKTFSSSPIVPAATTSTQAVNKGQLDIKSNSASPTFTGTVVLPSTTSIGNVSSTEIGYLDGVTSAIQTQLGTKANLASPTFTGTPLSTTAVVGTNTTQIATTAFVQSLLSTTYFDISTLFAGSVTTLNVPQILCKVNGTLVSISAVNVDINATTYWDNTTYATPANRNGKDFYVYVLSDGSLKLSINSTYPTGSDANNSRKVGGFHTLCNSVGTISGHTLTGYVTGNILPRSVWDLYNRASAGNAGMVKSLDGYWIDIYLPSWNGSQLVSSYGATIADGVSSPAFHGYKFEQQFGMIGKAMISQVEFVVASLGSNQSTNVTGSNDKGTTGGWTDTAGRRMISNIGCEDMCGLMWQWCRDTGGLTSGASWANAYDGNDSSVGGQHYEAPYRGILGGDWDNGVECGSRGSYWDYSPLDLFSAISSRGRSEAAKNRLI